MTTAVLGSPAIEKPSSRSREHQFFCGMSVLIALVIFTGFARTYFLAGLFHAKPERRLSFGRATAGSGPDLAPSLAMPMAIS